MRARIRLGLGVVDKLSPTAANSANIAMTTSRITPRRGCGPQELGWNMQYMIVPPLWFAVCS